MRTVPDQFLAGETTHLIEHADQLNCVAQAVLAEIAAAVLRENVAIKVLLAVAVAVARTAVGAVRTC